MPRRQAGGQAEESRTRSPFAAQEGLIHQRGLGPLAIDGQERRQRQRALPAELQTAASLLLEEVHPSLGLESRDQPVADVEQHGRRRRASPRPRGLAGRARARTTRRFKATAVAMLATAASATPHQIARTARFLQSPSRAQVARRPEPSDRSGLRSRPGLQSGGSWPWPTSASSMATIRMTSTPSRTIVTSEAKNAGPNARPAGLRAGRSRSRRRSRGASSRPSASSPLSPAADRRAAS